MRSLRRFLCSTLVLSVTLPLAAAHAAAATPIDGIAEAVASGRLDRAVATQLEHDGHVDATIQIEANDVFASAPSGTVTAGERARHYTDTVKPALAARKTRVQTSLHHRPKFARGYNNLPVIDAQFTSTEQLLDVLARPEVTGVRAHQQVPTTSMDIQSPALVRQPQAAAAGYRGAGQYVAVLDTGVNYRHADFGSCTAPGTPSTCRVAGAYEMAASDGSLDDDGHGSNVSGIVAGIAPGVQVLNYDVFNPISHLANDTDIKKAVDHVIGLRNAGYPVASINLSVGGGAYTASTCPADTIGAAAARAAGVTFVVASGNSASKSGIAWPACLTSSLSVGNVYDSSMGGMSWGNPIVCTDTSTAADKVVCSSQSASNLDMVAPGAMIDAAGYRMGGTSMAAPHVAAAAAIVKAAKPTASVSTIENALTSTGPLVGDTNGVTRRRLDVYAAVQQVVGTGTGTGDTTAPTVTVPKQTVTLGSQLGTTTVPITVSWSATDASGVAEYDIYSSTNGAAWVRETLASTTSTSKAFSLTPGNTYQFTVAAKDTAGNWSGWTNGPSFRVDNYAENNTALVYSTGWTRAAWTSAYGGSLTKASAANASVQFTFTGRGFAWVASKATNRGQAYLYLDGVYQGTWNLYSATTVARSVVSNWSATSSQTHTVKIVVVGSGTAPAVDVDSFIVLK
jgi:subtilisin family serine protease